MYFRNQIAMFDANALLNLPVLETLQLENNALTMFPNISQTTQGSNLTVFLNGNTFHCNCSFAFLLEVKLSRFYCSFIYMYVALGRTIFVAIKGYHVLYVHVFQASDAYNTYTNITVELDLLTCASPLTTTAYTSLTVEGICGKVQTTAYRQC